MNNKLIFILIIILSTLFFVAFIIGKNIGTDIASVDISVGNDIEIDSDSPITIYNQGGNMEGHTPRGFAGKGTGLFIGDNLNSGFPNGDGVQMFLTFDISKLINTKISSAFLRSNSQNTKITGTPFEDLGDIIVESIAYDTFSKNLWNKKSLSTVCIFTSSKEGGYSCDVSSFIQEIVLSGQDKAQLRIRFEKAGDGDKSQDMLSFYNINSNTNESGLFQLEIIPSNIKSQNTTRNIEIPITVHLVKNSDRYGKLRQLVYSIIP